MEAIIADEYIRTETTWTVQARIDALRTAKLLQTEEKQKLIGSMDHDDHGLIFRRLSGARSCRR